jgi:hypothetical protein
MSYKIKATKDNSKQWIKTLDETYLVHFYNERKQQILRAEAIFKDSETRYSKPKWRVIVGGSIHGELLKDNFKNKQEAIEYAKEYMRSH